jgi:nitrite reductase/ring-hydroxylating ferredoxin subunit
VNPAQPEPGLRLCAVDEVADPGAKGFLFRKDEALFAGFVVRRDGDILGYIDRCPHTGSPLAFMPDRFLTREKDLILCATHGALFRIGDGHCIAGPCEGLRLWRWAIEVKDGAVFTA